MSVKTEESIALLESFKRLARLRDEMGKIPAHHVHLERMLLYKLVHEAVCADAGYTPMGDMRLRWADWFLDLCAGDAVSTHYEHEDAVIFLLLEFEMEKCGKDRAAGV